MSLKTFYCPICGEEAKDCPHTENEIRYFQDKQQDIRREALNIIKQVVAVDEFQDMPVVPEWIDLVQKAKDFLKNNT